MKWPLLKLEDVCDIYGGTTPNTNVNEYWNGTIPWLSPTDLPEVGTISIVRDTIKKVTQLGVKDANLKILPVGTVVYSSRASIGKIGVTSSPITTNQGFVNFVCKEPVFNKYLAYALKFATPSISKLSNSTTFAEVSRGSIKSFKIPVPPLPIQQKIAAILDEADTLRRKDKALLDKYDELLQAVFYYMFGDLDIDSVGRCLGDVISINPKKSELNIAGDTLVSFVPMSCVGEKGECKPLEDRQLSEVKSGFTYFRDNDVLFAKITPCMENGKGAIARDLKNGVGFGSTEFHVLRPNSNVSAEFLYTYLSRSNFRKLAEKNMTGSAGQKRVSTDFLANLKLNIPDVDNQKKFALIYQNIQHQKSQIIQQQAHSENLFQSLMQRAFKGELVG